MLNSWERVNLQMAWNFIKASLQKGGDMAGLGMLIQSVILLETHHAEDGRQKLFRSGYRLRYKFTKSVADLYVDTAWSITQILDTTSADSTMITASVS